LALGLWLKAKTKSNATARSKTKSKTFRHRFTQINADRGEPIAKADSFPLTRDRNDKYPQPLISTNPRTCASLHLSAGRFRLLKPPFSGPKKLCHIFRFSARTRVVIEEKTVRNVQRLKNPAARLFCPASSCRPEFFESGWRAAAANIAPRHPANHISGSL